MSSARKPNTLEALKQNLLKHAHYYLKRTKGDFTYILTNRIQAITETALLADLPKVSWGREAPYEQRWMADVIPRFYGLGPSYRPSTTKKLSLVYHINAFDINQLIIKATGFIFMYYVSKYEFTLRHIAYLKAALASINGIPEFESRVIKTVPVLVTPLNKKGRKPLNLDDLKKCLGSEDGTPFAQMILDLTEEQLIKDMDNITLSHNRLRDGRTMDVIKRHYELDGYPYHRFKDIADIYQFSDARAQSLHAFGMRYIRYYYINKYYGE